MPDIDTPDPEITPSPSEIEEFPSGRTPDEMPQTTPNPSTGGGSDDPEDGAVQPPLGGTPV